MTVEQLMAILKDADPKGEVQIYQNDGRVEGWSQVAKAEQGMPVNDAEDCIIITVGECVAANSV
jgi:hypothetical protein